MTSETLPRVRAGRPPGIEPRGKGLLKHATIIGFGFVMTGRKQLSAEALIPDRTLNDIQRDTALVKEKLT